MSESEYVAKYSVVMFFFLMIRRPPRSTQSRSSAASDVYKRQVEGGVVDRAGTFGDPARHHHPDSRAVEDA